MYDLWQRNENVEKALADSSQYLPLIAKRWLKSVSLKI